MDQTEENLQRIRYYNHQEYCRARAEQTVYLLRTLALAVRDSKSTKGTWKTINGTHVKIDENTNEIIAGPPALKGKLSNRQKKIRKGNSRSIPLPPLQEQIDHGIISVLGRNKFSVRGMYQPQKWEDHWRRHGEVLKNLGIYNKEDYVKEAIHLLEQPVGGNILGHVDKQGCITRFDKNTGLFTIGHPIRGVYTLYIPDRIGNKKVTPIEYYYWQIKNDLIRGGRGK